MQRCVLNKYLLVMCVPIKTDTETERNLARNVLFHFDPGNAFSFDFVDDSLIDGREYGTMNS